MALSSAQRRMLLGVLFWTVLGAGFASAARAICGNGVVDGGETCDDSNLRDGDCCSAVCQLDTAGSSCLVDACSIGGSCDSAGACVGASPVACDDGLFCNGVEICDPSVGCRAGVLPAEGALWPGEIVISDPRQTQPELGAIVVAVDPDTGEQRPLTIGGYLSNPRDAQVEPDRCVLVPDPNSHAVIRIDPPAYDPANPAANQSIVSLGGNLVNPRGIVISPAGDLYVADSGSQHRVHRIDPRTGAQSVAAAKGYLYRPRHLTADREGFLYVPVYSGAYAPAIARIDPTAYDPANPFANQTLVASGGFFTANYGPWDLDFDADGMLLVVNAQRWELIRVDVDAYDPANPSANQQIVGAGGNFTMTRGIAVGDDGAIVVINESPSKVIRVDPDAYDSGDPASNQTLLASGAPLVAPRGGDVVDSHPLPEPGLELGIACASAVLFALRRNGRTGVEIYSEELRRAACINGWNRRASTIATLSWPSSASGSPVRTITSSRLGTARTI